MGYDPDTGDSIGKKLINTTDAEVWAKAFKDQFGDVAPDEGTMLAWFANALETGRNFGRKETCSHENCIGLAENLWACRRCGRVADHWPMEDGDGDTAPPEASLEDHFKEGFDEARG